MKNPAREHRIDEAIIREIEDAVDSANLLSIDRAIHAFENCVGERVDFSSDAEAFKCVALRALSATAIIGRMMADMRISRCDCNYE